MPLEKIQAPSEPPHPSMGYVFSGLLTFRSFVGKPVLSLSKDFVGNFVDKPLNNVDQ